MSTKTLIREGVEGNGKGRPGGAVKAPGARIAAGAVLTPQGTAEAPQTALRDASPEALRWQRNRLDRVLATRERAGLRFETPEALGEWLGQRMSFAQVEFEAHLDRERQRLTRDK